MYYIIAFKCSPLLALYIRCAWDRTDWMRLQWNIFREYKNKLFVMQLQRKYEILSHSGELYLHAILSCCGVSGWKMFSVLTNSPNSITPFFFRSNRVNNCRNSINFMKIFAIDHNILFCLFEKMNDKIYEPFLLGCSWCYCNWIVQARILPVTKQTVRPKTHGSRCEWTKKWNLPCEFGHHQ